MVSDEEDFLDHNVKRIVFNGVRDFYRCVTSTITKKFEFRDTVMEDVAFLLPENQESLTVAPVLRLATLFPAAVSVELVMP